MMYQEEHLEEKCEPKFFSRSTARHLRRKRLHNARRAEKQQEYLTDGINIKSDQECTTEQVCDQPEVVTKSKARRLRKKNKATLLENCCSFCDSYVCVPVAETPGNEEVTTDKVTEDIQTISKSKARRLRKRNKTSLDQNICSFCYDTYFSHIDSVDGKLRENIDSSVDINLKKEIELKSFPEADSLSVTVTTLSTNEELSKNVKNIIFSDFFKANTEPSPQEIAKVSPCTAELKNKCSDSFMHDSTKSANLVKDCSTIMQDCSSSLNILQKEVDPIETEVSSIENSENAESDRSVTQPPLKLPVSATMTDKKANIPEKTREEIKAEREAKKAAKAFAKTKSKTAGKAQEKGSFSNKPILPDSTKKKETDKAPERITNENIEVQDKTELPNKISNVSVKNVPSDTSNEGKYKAELRAERRAKQEAQRAAKQQLLADKNKAKSKEGNSNVEMTQVSVDTDAVNKTVTPQKNVPKGSAYALNLFKHLYHERGQTIVDVPFVNSNVHPAIIRLGTQYANKIIVGSNARCVTLLATVKQLIQDFVRPSQADFIRGLETSLQESVAYLHHCRPLAVSMQNALRHLKWQMTQLPSMLSDADAKSKLSSTIDTYIREQIELADEAISLTIQTKISNGDAILTYGYSSLIYKILLDAHRAKTNFRVIVVDGRPWLEGREQLRRLAKMGIDCSYILINALSYIMPQVSKVFLGAHAILANGAVMSRVGTAQVALMARAFKVPVLVACETHKSCERVQTDSIVYNELGNADELVQGCRHGTKECMLSNWKTKRSLNLLNITYDVTPADLVTGVVTELAILPCTSVPVILRIKPSEI